MSSSRFPSLRLAARRFVAETLLRGAPLSIAALSEESGLSERALRQTVEELTAEGALERLSGAYRLRAAPTYALGADLGGTKVAVALADAAGARLAEAAEPTDRRGGRYVLEQIRDIAARLASAEGLALGDIGAVAVGMPGVVHPSAGTVSLGPNIGDLADLDVRATLLQLFGRPALVENDVNLAMLAEATEGGARGCRNAGFLSLGTGIGLGLLINGALVRGAQGAAGEIAYLPLGRDLVSEAALETGALELDIGSPGALARYSALGGEARTVRDMFALARDGDRLAETMVSEIADKTALAITALQATLDLEKIVLGGGVGARPEFAARVRTAVARFFARPVDIAVSAFGNRAGLVGATALAARELRRRWLGLDEASLDFAEALE